jgi:hypothetical protein
MQAWRRASMSFVSVVMVVPGSIAFASPGWSSRPRWQLPAARASTCPHGWALGDRRVVRRDRARCADPAQPASAAPTLRPDPSPAQAASPQPPERGFAPTRWPDASSVAALDAPACHAVLQRHGVSFASLPAAEAPEVAQPIRLTGPIGDVTFVIPWSKDPDGDPHAIWDCRLAAAMIPVADWLSRHAVREVHYFSVLRKGAMARARPRSQHNVGLAIDVLGVIVQGASERWNVEDHYPVGVLTECPPPRLRRPAQHPAELWTHLVCQAVTGAWLHTILTPDHDHDHRNHLHLDLDLRQTAPADPFVSFATGGRSSK